MELSQTVWVVKGLLSEWGSCFRTVSLSSIPITLSYWENIIAVGCEHSDIIILDAITGSQIAVLSGHTKQVRCITFSSDGRSLASGSDDKTVKLWDVQTGGVIKTFHGHNHYVYSVSISGDYTRIVSGYEDYTICMWDIQTGECIHTIKQQNILQYAIFSPTDPQYIILMSGGKVWKWDFNSQQISTLFDAISLAFSPTYYSQLAFSSDCTQFALCNGQAIAVQNFNSGVTIAQPIIASGTTNYCCFSPDGKFLAAAAGETTYLSVYVWDISSTDCCLVGIFAGHTGDINALAFSSSSLISASSDGSVKFWQTATPATHWTVTGSESLLTPSPIQSVSLQAGAGIAISSDEAGTVKTWDLSSGLCKSSFQTPVNDCPWRDVQLIGSRLVIVWYKNGQIYIWDANKNESLWTVDSPLIGLVGLRISGDGTKFFLPNYKINPSMIHRYRRMCGPDGIGFGREMVLGPPPDG